MEIIYIFNGLGNQMSQYALYLQKKQLGQDVKCYFRNTAHNGIELGNLFNICIESCSYSFFYKLLCIIYSYNRHPNITKPVKWALNVLGIHGLLERGDYSFHQNVLKKHSGITVIIGGWHHYKYFNDIENVIRNTYKFPQFSDSKNLKIKEAGNDKRNVAIHIRRGDYIQSDKFGSVCDENYYMKSISYFENILKEPVFYVFSNDMEWSRNLLKNKKAVFVDWNVKENSWADMALMSSFKNLIIANSTFSWWAAWLGDNEIVLCPSNLIAGDKRSDIFMPNWKRIGKY